MTRKQTALLALAGAAVLLVGTRMAIVWAQQPPVAVSAPSADNIPRAPANFQPVPPGSSGRSFGGPAGVLPMMGPGLVANDDPEMTELLQSEATLARGADDLVARYAATGTAAERKEIAAELRPLLARQFDAQRQRREIELRRIEDQVRKLREQIKKRDEARDTIIDRRLEQLLTEAEGLGWAPAAGTRPPSGAGLPAGEMMHRMMTPATKSAPATR